MPSPAFWVSAGSGRAPVRISTDTLPAAGALVCRQGDSGVGASGASIGNFEVLGDGEKSLLASGVSLRLSWLGCCLKKKTSLVAV